MKPRIFWYSQVSLGEWHSEGFARRRNCSPSEQASLGHFLDWAYCELGFRPLKTSALQNKSEYLEKRFIRLVGEFWGMTVAPVQYS